LLLITARSSRPTSGVPLAVQVLLLLFLMLNVSFILIMNLLNA